MMFSNKKHNLKALTILLLAFLLLLLTDLKVKITPIYDNMGCNKCNALRYVLLFLFEVAFLKFTEVVFLKKKINMFIFIRIFK